LPEARNNAAIIRRIATHRCKCHVTPKPEIEPARPAGRAPGMLATPAGNG